MKLIQVLLISLIFTFSVCKAEDLFETLSFTYQNNKELNSQREKTKAVDEALIQSYAIFKPSITASTTRNDYNNSSQTNPSGSTLSDSNLQTKNNSIKVEQKLFQGIPQASKAEKDVFISRNQLLQTEQNVLYKAVDAYTSILSSKRNVDFTKDNLNTSEKQVELDKARYERGAIRLSDLSQSQSSLASARSKYIKANNDYLVSQKNFANIVGKQPGELKVLNGFNLNLPNSLNETIKLAETKNPNLLIAKLNYEKSKDDLNVALQEFAPKASLSYEITNSNDVSSSIDQQKQQHLQAKIEIPLYAGGKNYSFYKQKQALNISSELDYNYTKSEVIKNAENIWNDYQLKKSQLELAKAQLKAAEIAYEAITQEYENGSRTTLDVLSSRASLLDSNINFADTEKLEILSRFALLQVTGGLTAQNLNLNTKIIKSEDNLKNSWFRKIF